MIEARFKHIDVSELQAGFQLDLAIFKFIVLLVLKVCTGLQRLDITSMGAVPRKIVKAFMDSVNDWRNCEDLRHRRHTSAHIAPAFFKLRAIGNC